MFSCSSLPIFTREAKNGSSVRSGRFSRRTSALFPVFISFCLKGLDTKWFETNMQVAVAEILAGHISEGYGAMAGDIDVGATAVDGFVAVEDKFVL